MPGRPKLTALKKRIAENDLEDEIFEAFAEGLSVTKVCLLFQITSRKMFYDWKGKTGPRQNKYLAARLIAGEAHAEMAGEILDDLDKKQLLTGPDVQAAVARSKYQQWLASIKDRDQFGTQDKSAVINLNFGDLHMAALQSPGARPQEITSGEQVVLIPVEEIPNETEVGNDVGADAQSGQEIYGLNDPPASLASELGELL